MIRAKKDYGNKILTILICCYNTEKFLKECLDSLVNQTALTSSFNTLFINDASSDNSFEIAKPYSIILDNFKIINNSKNIGLIKCCNNALEIIDTPYFMRLDSDDYLSADAVAKILNELSSLDKKDFIVPKRWDIADGRLKKIDVTDDMYTWIATGTVFSTKSVKAVKGYGDNYWEEHDLYLKLLEAGYKYEISARRFYYYRRGHNSATLNYDKNTEGYKNLLKKWGLPILKKYGDLSRFKEYYNIKGE